MDALGETLITLMKQSRDDFSRKCYYMPCIPQRKLNNLMAAAECPADARVYALYDFTLFGSGKAGWLLTDYGAFVKRLLGKPQHYSYDELFQLLTHSNMLTGSKIYPLQQGEFWGDFFELYYDEDDSDEDVEEDTEIITTKCEYCGREFDAASDACPYCNAPVK